MLSEFGTRSYLEARCYYPHQIAFLDYVGANYEELAQFENSEELLGVNAKATDHIAQDWLDPNPRTTILRRLDGSTWREHGNAH